MKKLALCLFALLFCLSFAACANEEKDDFSLVIDENSNGLITFVNATVKEIVEAPCNTYVEAEETGFVLTLKSRGLQNASDETKALVLKKEPELKAAMDIALKQLRQITPECKFLKLNILCEEDRVLTELNVTAN